MAVATTCDRDGGWTGGRGASRCSRWRSRATRCESPSTPSPRFGPEMSEARRTLVAGFGNVLRADDGFGVEVLRRLRERGPIPGVDLIEIGTAGIRLAQELLTPYDRLIVVDAMTRGG